MDNSPEGRIGRLVLAQSNYSLALNACQNRGDLIFKHFRGKFGITQQQMANVLGVHVTYLSKIENSKIQPGYALLEKLHNLR